MAKIVYNACYGSFSLSRMAVKLGRKLSGDPMWGGPCLIGDRYEDGSLVEDFYSCYFDGPRDDKTLVCIVEELGFAASGPWSRLQIKEVPKGTAYRIDEYDGYESVKTQNNYNWKIAAD